MSRKSCTNQLSRCRENINSVYRFCLNICRKAKIQDKIWPGRIEATDASFNGFCIVNLSYVELNSIIERVSDSIDSFGNDGRTLLTIFSLYWLLSWMRALGNESFCIYSYHGPQAEHYTLCTSCIPKQCNVRKLSSGYEYSHRDSFWLFYQFDWWEWMIRPLHLHMHTRLLKTKFVLKTSGNKSLVRTEFTPLFVICFLATHSHSCTNQIKTVNGL